MSYPYQIKSIDQYHTAYKKSIEQPEKFWAEVAENFLWKKKMGQGLGLEFFST